MRSDAEAKAIFLVPPSYEEWLARIKNRGHMSPQEIKNRLTSAAKEFKAALEHDYYQFVVAENIQQSAEIIDAIAHDGINPHQDRGRSLIQQLYQRLTSENA